MPNDLVKSMIRKTDNSICFGDYSYSLDSMNKIVVIGTGKAAGLMALGFEQGLAEDINQIENFTGLVNAPEGEQPDCKIIEIAKVRPEGKNALTQKVIKATSIQLELIKDLGPNDLLIDLISGGGSATREQLCASISIEDLNKAVKTMQKNGASILEVNAMRKACSEVKGSKMSKHTNAGTVLAWVLSDVVGDSLDSIASGPWAKNTFSAKQTFEIIKKRGLENKSSVYKYIEANPVVCNESKKTKQKIEHKIIGNNKMAVQAVCTYLESEGYTAVNKGSAFTGKAREVGEKLFLENREMPKKTAFVFGGETTVNIDNFGEESKGGRAQRIALSAFLELWKSGDSFEDYLICAFGTDGEDGPTDVAGAMISAEQVTAFKNSRYKETGLEARLDTGSEYSVLKDISAHLKTGLTGTNVCDIWMILRK